MLHQTDLSESESQDLCRAYLGRILGAVSTLCLATDQEGPVEPPSGQTQATGEYLSQKIAEKLLEAANPTLLTTSLPPALKSLPDDYPPTDPSMGNLCDSDGEPIDENGGYRDWRKERSDHLRAICRAMAPIAFDVGARVVALVANSAESEIPPETTRSAFVLFATWLPIAPQLNPLAADLFALESFGCPFDSMDVANGPVQFVIVEAAHRIFEHFGKQGDHATTEQWWNWGSLFPLVILRPDNNDVEMKDESNCMKFDIREGTRWHAARAIGYLLGFRPLDFASYLERLGVYSNRVPSILHPWILDDEEEYSELLFLKGEATLLHKKDTLRLPTSEQVRKFVPLHSLLANVGQGVVLCKMHPLRHLRGPRPLVDTDVGFRQRQRLILTPTTARNLTLLGAALSRDPAPPPILVCGPHGSGKSSLIREMAHLCAPMDELLELHMDEETDSKTLIGSYTTTDIPGEFHWKPGALTRAVRTGQWVLLEDLDTVPAEIQAALVQLFENRLLPVTGGKVERCHPNFRLFGTCTTAVTETVRHGGSIGDSDSRRLRMSTSRHVGRKIVSPLLWRKVHVEPLAFSELKDVSLRLHPSLPATVVDSALNVLKALDRSGRLEGQAQSIDNVADAISPMPEKTLADELKIDNGRPASVRDFLKVLSRISHNVEFEVGATYVTEAQRTICLAECVDVFAAACPFSDQRRGFIQKIGAPVWGVSFDWALQYIETRCPSITQGANYTEIGRAQIPNKVTASPYEKTTKISYFATTNFSRRLMESIAVCISENEAALLVGETGVGKTSLLQQLARCSDRDLIVQNLSLQTDSTDLLGGYRPLELKHVARRLYLDFVDLFVSTFSRKQNQDFLNFASTVHQRGNWKKLSQCFQRAASLGLTKVKERSENDSETKASPSDVEAWSVFHASANKFERQRLACDSGIAFAFTEGALVDAIRTGKWVLLDEINLASSETLQRLCGLLDNSAGSVTLTERGDSEAVKRHPQFRLFAAMNPATDAGKKDLPPSIRSRFTEIYVDELLDALELRSVSARYLEGVLSSGKGSLEHTETVASCVDVYLQCRSLADKALVDAAGHKPRYTMRTLCRALSGARQLTRGQGMALNRSVLEGFELAFEGALDSGSSKAIQKLLHGTLGKSIQHKDRDFPSRRPGGRSSSEDFVLVKPFWIKAGPNEPVDWSSESGSGRPSFILTPSISVHLRRLARAVASGPWPILLEGPTSSGKTTIVEYLAARCGHSVVRINNHEHTDVQEYTGSYEADSNGSLSFRDGILVQALRKGHWVILDELNLAPSEVLEALNRLLDDNRELYLSEINETVKPHPNFRLFATQNPSGAYGGRKPLSRAFRNRFVELHMGDIPAEEMIIILERRCGCPPSHARSLVEIMKALRLRRSKAGVFLGKDGLITPRDLLRWAHRGASSKRDLAKEGYMLLAERLRNDEEKQIVVEEIEVRLKVKIDVEELYYGQASHAHKLLDSAFGPERKETILHLTGSSIAPTRSILRLMTLVSRCVKQKEPVLLVGDTGCGKTTVVQLLALLMDRKLHSVNCHATTETSDLIGGLRPIRGRSAIPQLIVSKAREFIQLIDSEAVRGKPIPTFLTTNNIQELPANCVEVARDFVSELWGTFREYQAPFAKRQKLEGQPVASAETDSKQQLETLVSEIEVLSRRYSSIFEWVDGPLVTAMRRGHMILLDEMSLAEDAVLERLNSVLEPTRTIVLAEKGDATAGVDPHESSGHVVVGHENFRIFATMNPGGDFGKRELSPALRSRFTEIWVPPVTDPSDIAMVLDETLTGNSDALEANIRDMILKYVSWFNLDICGQPSSPCASIALSLRDVLAWAKFIVAVSKTCSGLSIWEAYCHGACLMHLDGLGLGTGLSLDDAASTKAVASSYLLSNIPPEFLSRCSAILENRISIEVKGDDAFGMPPFFIPKGPLPLPDSGFSFEAPTTALNLSRVLRAMQVPKPILLEGSPGVGKTSLISALAAASGNKLVRINLSEQTDISDLMGSDLPVPSLSEDDSSGQQARRAGTESSFQWCDGVLLQAIRRGDWVLLDELNLANQSVLEGLNSCLDHRASVFIPELGQTVSCPPSFRVFAAQNPLAQGGGRKGLPKSFLNRFTKVYIESLAMDDLRRILARRFPLIPSSVTDRMIEFNEAVHLSVVDQHEFGDAGSPWEFNLRDIFRWCELLTGRTVSEDLIDRSACTVYLRRFRTNEDRHSLEVCYSRYFGRALSMARLPTFIVKTETVQVGDVILDRYTDGRSPVDLNAVNDSILYRTLLRPLESVAQCIKMKWPCLLVGPSASGKSATVQSVAELCNARLVTISLTPVSDVNELVGSFEQSDSDQDLKMLQASFMSLFRSACLHLVGEEEHSKILCDISDLLPAMESCGLEEMATLGKTLSSLFRRAMLICDRFKKIAEPTFANVETYLRKISTAHEAGSHFRWVDGVLVTAMSQGHWIHLENINLCSSSVLDRLNPLMEKDGELLLTECSVRDDSQVDGDSHRIVRQHPNFRLFLSMDPHFGEVSRAMRNRCVEVALIPPSGMLKHDGGSELSCKETTVDGLDSAWHAGLRSLSLSTTCLKLHSFEMELAKEGRCDPVTPRHLQEWALALKGSMNRGLSVTSALVSSTQLIYELNDHQSQVNVSRGLGEIENAGHGPSMESPRLRWGWSHNPEESTILFSARLVKLYRAWKVSQFDCLGTFPNGLSRFDDADGESDTLSARYARLCPVVPNTSLALETIQRSALVQFVERGTPEVLAESFSLDGYPGEIKHFARLASSLLQRGLQNRQDYLQALTARRLPLELRKRATYSSALSTDLTEALTGGSLSVIAASYSLYEGRLEGSLVLCPVTPLLYPFIRATKEWIDRILFQIGATNGHRKELVPAIDNVLEDIDRMWIFLAETVYSIQKASDFLGFAESSFIILWRWLKKSLALLCEAPDNNVSMLIRSIDQAVFGSSGEVGPLSSLVWKTMGHPRVPKKSDDWNAIHSLSRLARACSIFGEDAYSASNDKVCGLGDLLKSHHLLLCISKEDKYDLLEALSMMFISSTEEIGTNWKARYSAFDIQKAEKTVLVQLAKQRQRLKLDHQAVQIDSKISTVEYMLDAEAMDKLQATSMNESFTDEVLFRFARLQLCPLVEVWCVQEEQRLMGILLNLLGGAPEDASLKEHLLALSHRLEAYLSIAVARSAWPVSDFRPHHTLLWACKSSDGFLANELQHLLRCLLPRMMSSAIRHVWVNTFSDLSIVSYELGLPSPWETDKDSVVSGTCLATPRNMSGPARLFRPLKTEVVFRLFGGEYAAGFTSVQNVTCATVENHSVRRWQLGQLVDDLSAFSFQEPSCFARHHVRAMVSRVVEALKDTFSRDCGTILLELLSDSEGLKKADAVYLQDILKACNHPSWTECLSTIVNPLFLVLSNPIDDDDETDALSWVYAGMLQMQLLVPRSPLDPGQKPLAKVMQWGRYFSEIQAKIAALRLDNGYSRGDFKPDSNEAMDLITKAEQALNKRSRQSKKVLERPNDAAPFIDLFRESRQFWKLSVDDGGIADLVAVIRRAKTVPEEKGHAQRRESLWQETAESFCDRMMSHFAPYEDVVLPYVNAIQVVRVGLSLLRRISLEDKGNAQGSASCLSSLLSFPVGNLSEDLAIPPSLGVSCTGDCFVRAREIAFLALSLAKLARIDLRRHVYGRLRLQEVYDCNETFMILARGWLARAEEQHDEAPATDELALEKAYRDQFPDHAVEFQKVLDYVERDVDDEKGDSPVNEASAAQSEVLGSIRLSDEQMSLLCTLHKDIYCEAKAEAQISSRVRTFRLTYLAAYFLYQSSLDVPSGEAKFGGGIKEPTGAHLLALSLGPVHANTSTSFSDLGEPIDFYKGANPLEVTKSSIPLRRLSSRTAQLLRAFPGHAILVSVGQVTERILHLPLHSTSVGKALTGLELVLRKAQEWEQHASDRVKLGQPLSDVSDLVAKWRKLELESWSMLLDLREKRYVKQAQGLWARLYSLLHHAQREPLLADLPRGQGYLVSSASPQWVWKGMTKEAGYLATSLLVSPKSASLLELTKAIDTFLLTSSLGEWAERLEIIKAFSNQFSRYQTSEEQIDESCVKLARILSSLVAYYSQFQPGIQAHMSDRRRPIERRLKDEVRLSKWDEQSYYALADSTERNQRKLMRLLREYDEVLDTSVASIVERISCQGVRSTDVSHDEPIATIPPLGSMFALVEEDTRPSGSDENVENIATHLRVKTPAILENVNKGASTIACDKFVSEMGHYKRRLSTLLKKECLVSSWSKEGAEKASLVCSSIFDRIDSLRKPKATKQMKERALVDLFKALKDEGYHTTKWAVPVEIRQMFYVLQLPIPAPSSDIMLTHDISGLERGELYFQKVVAELERMRSEISLSGSRYMSSREMQIMQSFGDHGLLVLGQQRCMLAKVIAESSHLQNRNSSFLRLNQNLPHGQTRLLKAAEEFQEAFLSVTENLTQLSILKKRTSPILEKESKREKLRDGVAALEDCVAALKDLSPSILSSFVTEDSIIDVSERVEMLKSVKRQLEDLQEDCQTSKCLPIDIYTPCVTEIKRALFLGSMICDSRGDELDETVGNTVTATEYLHSVSSIVQASLISVQGLIKDCQTTSQSPTENSNDKRLIECHKAAAREFAALNLTELNLKYGHLSTALLSLHDGVSTSESEKEFCVAASTSLATIIQEIVATSRQKIGEMIAFYSESAKLSYVYIRVFRILVAKGFCSVDSEDGGEGSAEGNVSGMTFEDDQDGTGMGEGEGKQDVTDQLESEEQILGLKGQDDEMNPDKPERQLGEEEARQGMEMEGDFEGDMFDVPEPEPDDDPEENQDGEEELEREMGDGSDPNEQVVDEKLWDASDDEGGDGHQEEKFEKDSNVKGETLEDEMRTKEEDGQGSRNEEQDAEENPSSKADAPRDRHDDNQDPDINEDMPEDYEDKNIGVDVRDEREEQQPQSEEVEEQPQFDDNLDLDETGNEDEAAADNMDVDESGSVASDKGDDSENGRLEEPDADDAEIEESAEETAGIRPHTADYPHDDPDDADQEPETEADYPELNTPKSESMTQQTQGIRSKNGADNIVDDGQEDDEMEDEGEGEGEESGNADKAENGPQGASGSDGGGTGNRTNATMNTVEDDTAPQPQRTPNPFRDPGDASRYWHKKLKMAELEPESNETNTSRQDESTDPKDKRGEFEYAPETQPDSTQVLGEAGEDEVAHLDPLQQDDNGTDDGTDEAVQESARTDEPKESRSTSRKSRSTKSSDRMDADENAVEDEKEMSSEHELGDDEMDVEGEQMDEDASIEDNQETEREVPSGNRIISDLNQLHVQDDIDMDAAAEIRDVVEEDHTMGMTALEAASARAHWSKVQAETQNLSRRLCEKLRLVMEPLVATKLRGDYRTGKRINMKRVIGYVASGYRKDKIWLRRTKPAKRNYRVLLAVDDSESMQKSHAGEMALAALATLVTGMSQLEIGELGIASFGEEMRLVHPFHIPFTSESGANIVHSFPFNEKRTRTSLCVESALSVMETPGDYAALQLVFLISDGRIERDSRAEVRRLVREMVERNILLVMIIVEGESSNKKDSLVHMREVSFENGKPKVKQFIEDYPFPYYIFLEDLHSLPEVLGDALRQWFEMIAQLQSK